MRIGFEFCLVMAFLVALVVGVSAAPKVPISKPGAGMTIHVNPGTVAPPTGVPLTEAECEGLGGGVVPDKVCSSGAYCMTEDQAGNRRRVCLTVFVP